MIELVGGDSLGALVGVTEHGSMPAMEVTVSDNDERFRIGFEVTFDCGSVAKIG